MKYKDWLTEWLEYYIKPTKKEITYYKYKRIAINQICDVLGEYELDELSAPILQQHVAKLTIKFSSNTVIGIIGVIRNSLVSAQKNGIIEKQFSDAIQRPKVIEKNVECFSLSEQKIIEKYIIQSEKKKLSGIILCLYTGLRIGELLALEWCDIDLANRTIQISKTCYDQWENGKYHKTIGVPKTDSSRRIIPFPQQLSSYLKALKKQSNSPYFISGKNGEVISVRSYQRSFELLLKRLEIPRHGFHSLRHTFATRALECGMDVKTLSEILGHKNPTITLNRYAHSLMEHKSAMMNKVGKLFQ